MGFSIQQDEKTPPNMRFMVCIVQQCDTSKDRVENALHCVFVRSVPTRRDTLSPIEVEITAAHAKIMS